MSCAKAVSIKQVDMCKIWVTEWHTVIWKPWSSHSKHSASLWFFCDYSKFQSLWRLISKWMASSSIHGLLSKTFLETVSTSPDYNASIYARVDVWLYKNTHNSQILLSTCYSYQLQKLRNLRTLAILITKSQPFTQIRPYFQKARQLRSLPIMENKHNPSVSQRAMSSN